MLYDLPVDSLEDCREWKLLEETKVADLEGYERFRVERGKTRRPHITIEDVMKLSTSEPHFVLLWTM